MHVPFNFMNHSANSCHKCTETMIGLYYHQYGLCVCFIQSRFLVKLIIVYQMLVMAATL